jgi:hypothetical protein
MNHAVVLRSVAALSLVTLFAAAPASAADTPDLVGTWKTSGEMPRAHWGSGNEHGLDAAATPTAKMVASDWSFVIEAQDGRAFYGHATSPKGTKETLVGVIRRDNKTLVLSGDNAGLEGLVEGNEMELCFADHASGKAHAFCTVMVKQ